MLTYADCLLALQHNPLTPEAFSAYAAFLDEVKADMSGAYVLYKRAVQLAPGHEQSACSKSSRR